MHASVAVLSLAGLVAAQTTPMPPMVTPPATNGTTISTVTRVVSTFTTYCPEPTIFTYNGKGYTVTEATTLTITDCPCTITEPTTLATGGMMKPSASAGNPSPSTGGEMPPAKGGEQPPANGGEQPPTNGGEQPPANGGGNDAPVSGAAGVQAGAVAFAGLLAAVAFAL